MSSYEVISLLVVATFISAIAISTSKINNTELEIVLLNSSTSPCTRPCDVNSPPMVCRYTFEIEWYTTMSKACFDCPYNLTDCDRSHCIPADGFERTITVVNRQLPGPSIEVCEGDRIIVDVNNKLMVETTTLHWHGFHQRGTPYMDGVPYITQCPIQPGTTFRYSFHARNPGTHFWHSHSGLQRADGVFGPFIVRVPDSKNVHAHQYDYDKSEHVIIFLDWAHDIGVQKYATHFHNAGSNKPQTILVNGKGRFTGFDQSSGDVIYTPTAKFNVDQGYKYRFRVINAGIYTCPIELSVDNHTMTIISSDGNDIEPVTVDSLVTFAGERFDFVLTADQEIDNYWIRFAGLLDCDLKFEGAHQVAILHYENANDTDPEDDIDYESSIREGLQLNPSNKPKSDSNSYTIPELNSTDADDIILKKVPDYQFYITYDFHPLNYPMYHRDGYGFFEVSKPKRRPTPQLNHLSFKLQPFPLLSRRDLITPEMLCNSTSSECYDTVCECTHVLQIPLNSVVELVLIDNGLTFDVNHPFHLHGHAFRVIGTDKLGSNLTLEDFQALDSKGLIERKLSKAPFKDTITVPDGGYTILRFRASNPGYWLFHCHIEFHVEVGMSLVFKVGEHDQFPPVPKGFPECNDWIPSEELSGTDELTDFTTEKTQNNNVTSTENGNHWWSFSFGDRNSASTFATTVFYRPYLISFLLIMFVL